MNKTNIIVKEETRNTIIIRTISESDLHSTKMLRHISLPFNPHMWYKKNKINHDLMLIL